MDYKTWRDETYRGMWKPRSKALKAIDKAFEKCRNSRTGQLYYRQVLMEKLVAWINKKGARWKQSIRNSRKDLLGRGTVEQLLDTFVHDPHFRPYLVTAGLAAPPAPPPKVRNASRNARVAAPTAPPRGRIAGRWEQDRDRDGHFHEFIRQKKGSSCVPATITMMKRARHWLSASQLNEDEIRGLMALEERGELNTGKSALSNLAQTHHNWEIKGTGPTQAAAILRGNPYPVPGAKAYAGAAVRLTDLQQLKSSKPCLLGWKWRGRGGHFTMCIGPTRDDTQLKILDPWYGIQYLDNSDPGFRTYTTDTGAIGDLSAAVIAPSS